jgi:hypothetical protein
MNTITVNKESQRTSQIDLTSKEASKNLWNANQKFQAKIGWKRAEAKEIRRQIRMFISDNFNIYLPNTRKEYKKELHFNRSGSEEWNFLEENYGQMIKYYYTLGEYGLTLGHVFKDEKTGRVETFARMHIYSRHRLDPVWNMRKSQLIRTIYKDFLVKSDIIEQQLHPIHITLTLPHAGGLYQGKRFYARELIEAFNLIRKYPKWKEFVYGGEYGVEIKKSPNGNGLHIHIHSFTLLKKGQSVNKFRDWLKKTWLRLTSGSQIWVETLYFYKKDDQGAYITEKKGFKLITTEQYDGSYITDYESEKEVRKKFYVDAEVRKLTSTATALEFEEIMEQVKNIYLAGIMETIKYHFKMDDLFQTGSQKLYDIDLINEILVNTKNKRLYSRFGKFYNEPSLNFNQIADKEPDESEPENEESLMAEALNTVTNPFTFENVNPDEIELFAWRPENQKRQPLSSDIAYKLINCYSTDYLVPLGIGISLRNAIKEWLKARSGRMTSLTSV